MTLSSQSGDDIDFVYSFLGMSWRGIFIKMLSVTMHLYLAKGSSQYLAVWEETDFLVPRSPFSDFSSILKSFSKPSTNSVDVYGHLKTSTDTNLQVYKCSLCDTLLHFTCLVNHPVFIICITSYSNQHRLSLQWEPP